MPLSTDGSLAPSVVGVAPHLRIDVTQSMLARLVPKYRFLKDAQNATLPRTSPDVIQWRRRNRIVVSDPTDHQLTEGVTPDALTRSTDAIKATIYQFGGYLTMTDKTEIMAMDPLLMLDMDDLTTFQAEVEDTYVREQIKAGTNVFRVNARASRGAIVSTDVLDDLTLKKAVAFLRNQNVPTFPDNTYHAIIPAYATFDLFNTDGYKNTGYYQKADDIKNGTVEKLYGVTFMDTSLAIKFTGAGSGSIDVYGTVVYGPGAFGAPDYKSMASRFINKPVGSAGAADPLDQRGSRGTKSALGAKILDENKMVRIEHALGFSG